MKKVFALILAVTMLGTMFAGCGKKETAKEPLKGTMEEIVNQIIEAKPVDFMAGIAPLDITDTSEDGLWALNNYTGLKNADKISDAAVYEAMMGSLAFSMVLVRVKDAADAEAVAKEMNEGINPRKWICVEANDKKVATYSDTVMLIMLDSGLDMAAQDYIDAFKTICGGELDFTI